MNDAEALGRAIESEMVANGLTRKELADVMGVSADSLGKYLRGEVEPSLGRLRVFATALNCTVGYLIGRQEQIMGWTRGPVTQAILGEGNNQVTGLSSTVGDASADDQSVNIAGATVFGDVKVVRPDGDEER
ncbi:MAG: helix-turn-helix transcriptional regulator [Micropruina sp.]|uniref:helix-turn-helix domain-containing protein n=1 Tax=Micropruina sp. TaxID=2737536 RepID=UPI0039E36165